MQDPPVHTEFRKLVSRGFTPRQVEAVEPKVREFVVERIEGLRSPTAAATSSPSCSNRCRRWWSPTISVCPRKTGPNSTAGPRRSSPPTPPKAASPARWKPSAMRSASMMAYFTGLIERRRTEPGDDTISQLVRTGFPADATCRSCRCSRSSPSRWSPAATTPPPACSALMAELLTRHPATSVAASCRSGPPLDRSGRGGASPVGPGRGAGSHHHARRGSCAARPSRSTEGAACLRVGQPRRPPIRSDADELDVARCQRHILTFSHGAHHCLGAGPPGCRTGSR